MSDILNHRLIGQRYFFPRRDGFSDPYWIDCGDARLACHYHQVDPDALTVVHFHGNGEVVADYAGILPEILGRFGCNCLLAEFRGYGLSTGQPGLGRILDDVGAIVAAIPAPVRRMVFFGRSVGSIPAVHAVALFPDAAGLILESGVADVLERLLLRISPNELGVGPEALRLAVERRLDQEKKMASYTGPVLVMHAAQDGLVDASHGRRLHDWAAGRRKHLELFDRGDHNSIMVVNATRYFGLVGDFLRELA